MEPIADPIVHEALLADRLLLGAALRDAGACDKIVREFPASLIFDPWHRDIYASIGEIHRSGQIVSPQKVKSKLQGNPAFDKLGHDYIEGLRNGCPLKFDVEALIKRAKEVLDPSSAVPKCPHPIFTSGAFVRGFTAPDYLWDGVFQKGFLYSLTGATGAGKTSIALRLLAHAALGRPLCGLDVTKVRGLMLVGENPDDARARWIGLAHHMGFDPDAIDIHFMPGVFSIPDLLENIRVNAEALGGVGLIVVDTSAAYFLGNDENANTEAGDHARSLRTLTTLPGKPCVIVNCHPVKNAAENNLLPRGGGAFIAEVDGNACCYMKDGATELHWQGKFRGPEFEPMGFEMTTVRCDALLDSRGRQMPTVVAVPLSRADQERRATADDNDLSRLMVCMLDHDRASIAALAVALDWTLSTQEPHKTRVTRALTKLEKANFAKQELGKWILTEPGKKRAKEVKNALQ